MQSITGNEKQLSIMCYPDDIITVHKQITGGRICCCINNLEDTLISRQFHFYFKFDGQIVTPGKDLISLPPKSNNRDLQQLKIPQKTKNSDRSVIRI